jgi:hypothetical protein
MTDITVQNTILQGKKTIFINHTATVSINYTTVDP